jgi:SAM-dependent methyltransferase
MPDDPVTGRRMLTESAYADDRHLRSRQAIWAYAEQPAEPGWRTSMVAWDGTQAVADVGCGNGFDLRQIVPAGRCRHAIGLDLSAGMLRSLDGLRGPGRLSLVRADAQRLPLGEASVDVALAMHMLYHVPDIPAAVRELRRITRPAGTVLASTNGTGSLSEVYLLFDAAVRDALGRPVRTRPELSFSLETGRAILEGEFEDVTLHQREVTLSIPQAQPLVAYVNSIRDPIQRYVGEPFDFDAALDGFAARVEQIIGERGRFRAVGRTGVFVCRGG